MRIILGLWGIVALFSGVALLADARNPISQVEAGIAFLIATVALGAAGIIEELRKGNGPTRSAAREKSGLSKPFYEP